MKHQWNIWDDLLIPFGAFLALTLFLSANARADDNFISAQPKLEFVFDAALMADMLTTADIKNNPGLYETNAILGTHPSDTKIVFYGLGAASLHAVITYEMVSHDVPRGIITAWELISIGVETSYVVHNYNIGLRIKF